VLLEFVSANPTGPLHVGHGRGAAYGATVANLLRVVGFEVDNEYYVNDAGRQMDILATSVYLRYVETDKFPDNGYKGDYIFDIAKKIQGIEKLDIFSGICKDEKHGGDKEKHIDGSTVLLDWQIQTPITPADPRPHWTNHSPLPKPKGTLPRILR
jgi:arginyl-tRNA synthetase